MNKFPDMKGLQFNASFTGVFGRNRKAKFESKELTNLVKEEQDITDWIKDPRNIQYLEDLVKCWMKDMLKVKSVQGDVRIDCNERDTETGAIAFPGTTVHRFTF